jgi:hypothetical protein
MPLELINIPALRAELLKKLETVNRTGLFLAPLRKRYSLTATDLDHLIQRLTADGALRLDSPWTRSATDEIREVSFIRGEED